MPKYCLPVAVLAALAATASACSDSPGPIASTDGGPRQVNGTDAAVPTDAGPVGLGSLTLVGHHDLERYGDASALALSGSHAYVAGRAALRPIHILDISDPTRPEKVGELALDGADDESRESIEIRAIPDLHRLYVATTGRQGLLRVFDTTDPRAPALLGAYRYEGGEGAHEFFLWRDPTSPARVLVYSAGYVTSTFLRVLDVSDPAAIRSLATFSSRSVGNFVIHSVSVSPDGRTTHVAGTGDGYYALDTSDLAANLPAPELRLVTPRTARVDYGAATGGMSAHSAVAIPGRPVVLVADEIYECPFGWVHFVDVSDPLAPQLLGELRMPENVESTATCGAEGRVINSAHNPTVTEHLALVSWYDRGLQIFDTSDPRNPVRLAEYLPEVLEDVRLPWWGDVAMWSYPIIQDGLVYVVDTHNGFFVLRYEGPHAEEIANRTFLEGNSNL